MRWLVALACCTACGDSSTAPISFGSIGPLSSDAGKGGFRFGVATAATQIEDMNPNTDWYVWTEPTAQGGLGKDTFVGDAVDGFSQDLADVGLIADMGLDSYRFSIEWARIEPQKGVIDETAIAHYRAELQALHDMGIRPLVTVLHFSVPVWVGDPRAISCPDGPTDTNLCGFGSAGGPQIILAAQAHAVLLAQRFGDLVDEWGTVNEPINYLIASYGAGTFPPGKGLVFDLPSLVAVLRDYLTIHAAIYTAIKQNDTIDADGDGIAASVGFSMSVADWEPARGNKPSTDPDDIAARDRLVYIFHYLWVDAVMQGGLDTDFDGTIDEPHPEWQGTVDWLGLQYYLRGGVTSAPAAFPPPISLTPCVLGFDLGACLPAPDQTYCVGQMGYEFYPPAIRDLLGAFAKRYPGLPLVVTESGIASDVGTRRAEQIVRTLEAIAAARDSDGVDVRGFYEWSLTDNFEWAQGFAPHFGLYSVDDATYARTATEGATVLGAISSSRIVTKAQRSQYGGTGPLTADTVSTDSFCTVP